MQIRSSLRCFAPPAAGRFLSCRKKSFMKLLRKLFSNPVAVEDKPDFSEPRISGTDADSLNALPDPFRRKLLSMYESTKHVGSDGLEHDAFVATKISVLEGMEIYSICRKLRAKSTLEVGLAYGFSTLYFLAASTDSHHTAIDPFIIESWHGVGLRNIKQLGLESRVRLLQEISLLALPRLLMEAAKFDVIFIDGNHRFDDVLSDFTLCAMLSNEGGYIILDDMWMPSIQKVASFIRSNRRDFTEVSTNVFNISVFKKTTQDTRPWDHFKPFV